MSINRKLSMASAALRIGRRFSGQTTLLAACGKHGGLLRFKGDASINAIETTTRGAPKLHWRDSSGDVILYVEVLVEEDYRCLRELNVEPAHILDIGANIGLGSFFLRQLYPKAHITAFEPSAAEARILKMNLDAWGDCEHRDVAVGDRDGTVTFAIDPQRTGGQHITDSTEDTSWQHITVPVCRIETLIDSDQLSLPDLVKMDIEGAEVEALRGFGKHIASPQAYVLETHSPDLHQSCLSILGDAGYRVTWDEPRNATARILCMARS